MKRSDQLAQRGRLSRTRVDWSELDATLRKAIVTVVLVLDEDDD